MTAELAIKEYCERRDPAAFRAVVEQYQRLVYSAASRMLHRSQDAEDVTQQTFLTLARSACVIRQDLAGWLYSTACNAARDLIRKDASRRRVETVAAMESRRSANDGEMPESAQLAEAVDAAMQELPTEQQSLIAEHFLAGRTQRELAAVMGISQSTLSRRVDDAVTALRAKLKSANLSLTLPAAGLLEAKLSNLSHAAELPGDLTSNLVKIGLSGTPSVAASSGVALTTLSKIAVATALFVAATLAVIAWQWKGAAPAPAQTATTKPTRLAPKSREEALTRLSEIYALKPEENLRIISAPFPDERTDWVNLRFPHAGGADRVQSIGMHVTPDGHLDDSYMSYADFGSTTILELTLGLDWFRVENRTLIDWPTRQADTVIREGLSTEQKLDGLAKVMKTTTGQDFRFEKRFDHRPCVVLKGTKERRGLRDKGGFDIVAVTVDPLTQEELATWVAGSRPRGGTNAFSFGDASKQFDTPFIHDDSEASEHDDVGSYFVIAPDARFQRTDPDYRAKLLKIVQNIKAQLGGDWTVEDRDVEVWHPVVGKK